MENKIPSYLLHGPTEPAKPCKTKRAKLTFLEKTILNSAKAVKSIYLQEENSARGNIIQKINPRIKLISLIYMAIVISIVNNPAAQLLITIFIIILYFIAGLRVFAVYRKIFFLAFVFGFVVVLPASLNIITPGEIIFNILKFDKASQFLIYSIPQNIGLTRNGLLVVSLVFLRVFNSISFSMLIVFTTPFPAFIKSFKILGVPDTFLMIISLAYKFIFILSRTIEETFFALKSRLSGSIKNSKARKLVSGRIFFIFKRSAVIYESTYNAMVSRGYRGKIYLHSQTIFALKDYVALGILVAFGTAVILFK